MAQQTRSSRGFSLQVDAGAVQMRPADASAVAYVPIPSNPIDYKKKREFHDKPWSILFAIGFLAFFAVGGAVHSQALSSDFATFGTEITNLEKACYCANYPDTKEGKAFGCNGSRRTLTAAEHHRRLATAIENGQTIWSLLSNMPEVPATMIALVMAISVGWILALQRPTISRITVGLTLVAKIAFLVYLGIETTGTAQIIFFALAILACLVIYQSRAAIELACKLISESACGLSANPGVVGTSILAYLPYAGYVALWMVFLASTGRYWVAEPYEEPFAFVQDAGCPTGMACGCKAQLSSTAPHAVRYLMFHFLWVTGFLEQVRLTIVSGTIGTWYFQGTQNVPAKPSLFWLKTALTTSGGSLTIGATVAAIVEWIKMKANARCWFCNPWGIICRVFLCVFQTLIMAITRMCTVVHVFTGDSFCQAKDRTFALLKRNFVGGVASETISKMLFNTAGWLFSVALTCAAWAWFETSDANVYGCSPQPPKVGDVRPPCIGTTKKVLTGGQGGFELYLWLFLMLFGVKDPVIFVALLGMFIAPIATGFLGGYPIIIPLCAIFIGCVAHMCFKYMAGVMMDATSAIFVSYAIDRENGTVSNDRESMRKILDSMPCMYSVVPTQPVNLVQAGVPVVQGVAVPMQPVQGVAMTSADPSLMEAGKVPSA